MLQGVVGKVLGVYTQGWLCEPRRKRWHDGLGFDWLLIRLVKQQRLLGSCGMVSSQATLDPTFQAVDSLRNFLLDFSSFSITRTFRSSPKGTDGRHQGLDRRRAIRGCRRTTIPIRSCHCAHSGLNRDSVAS
jgi:hypothetical protein